MNLEEYQLMTYDDVEKVFTVRIEGITVEVPYEMVIGMLELKLDV